MFSENRIEWYGSPEKIIFDKLKFLLNEYDKKNPKNVRNIIYYLSELPILPLEDRTDIIGVIRKRLENSFKHSEHYGMEFTTYLNETFNSKNTPEEFMYSLLRDDWDDIKLKLKNIPFSQKKKSLNTIVEEISKKKMYHHRKNSKDDSKSDRESKLSIYSLSLNN